MHLRREVAINITMVAFHSGEMCKCRLYIRVIPHKEKDILGIQVVDGVTNEVSVHKTDGRLTVRSREVSKPRD